jgi:hypothetical protein
MYNENLLCFGNQNLAKVFCKILLGAVVVGILGYLVISYDLSHNGEIVSYKSLLKRNNSNLMHTSFPEYLAYFGKSYPDQEEFKIRQTIFNDTIHRLAKVYQEDGGNTSTYHMVINEFADLTDQEFQVYATGAISLDERLDMTSTFFDFDKMEEIDNLAIKKYLD